MKVLNCSADLPKDLCRIIGTVLPVLVLAYLFTGCSNNEKIELIHDPDLVPENIIALYQCNAEAVSEDKQIFVSDGTNFSGVAARSEEYSFSGEYSIKLDTINPFGFSTTITGLAPDDYFVVRVKRRKNAGNSGYITVSTPDSKFYIKEKQNARSLNDTWEELTLKFHTPPDITGSKLKLYLWNPDSIPVYFDDIEIYKLQNKIYPEYTEQALLFQIDSAGMNQLKQKRLAAYKAGVLDVGKADWVRALLIYGSDSFNVSVRLKGDWLSHLDGEKWSFRINIKDDKFWKGMDEFSVQNPTARYYQYEWLLHEILEKEDVLTTSYGFIPVTLNGKNLGIYAWEEHFTKRLVESRNRREGPIIRFSEDVFWEMMQIVIKDKDKYLHTFFPSVEASPVVPFSKKKTKANPVLYNQFKIAQNLMNQYMYSKKNASEIFDIDRLARYFAVLNITKGYHTLTWHNQRFYFNPVINRIEPIVYDSYTESGVYDIFPTAILGDFNPVIIDRNVLMKHKLFADKEFVKRYITYLEKYSSVEYLSEITAEFSESMTYYENILQKEYPGYNMSIEYIESNTLEIRNALPKYIEDTRRDDYYNNRACLEIPDNYDSYYIGDDPDVFVFAYNEVGTDSMVIINTLPESINILGYGNQKEQPEVMFTNDLQLGAHSINKEPPSLSTGIRGDAKYLFFSIEGLDTLLRSKASSWPAPDGYVPEQEILNNSGDAYKEIFELDEKKRTLTFTGSVKFEKSIIIPSGYTVYFPPGSYLDLTKRAAFISRSNVIIEGTKEKPVTIISTDKSAQGFTVLQAVEKSQITYTNFELLNTLDYNGWVLTGAVTFYESEVKIQNSNFSSSQCEDGLNIIRSEFAIENSLFTRSFGDAFDSDFSKGDIIGCQFEKINNDAIDLSGSQVMIMNCEIDGVGDKGVSAGEVSTTTVSDTKVYNANIGLASKDNSYIEVVNSAISDCVYGIALYVKKQEYDFPEINLSDTKLVNLKTPYFVEKGAKLIMDGKQVQHYSKDSIPTISVDPN